MIFQESDSKAAAVPSSSKADKPSPGKTNLTEAGLSLASSMGLTSLGCHGNMNLSDIAGN